MNEAIKKISYSAIALTAFGFCCLLTVSLFFLILKKPIAHNERLSFLDSFHQIMPTEYYNNDLVSDHYSIILDGEPQEIYPAKKDGQLSAYFIKTTTHKGYSGDIDILLAFRPDGMIVGARVLKHKETPGLGDKIERKISPWIDDFIGRSLENTRFAVKKDGGDFDSFSGATITPRAIVNQIAYILQAYQETPERFRANLKSAE